MIALASADEVDEDSWSELREGVGTVDLSLDPDEVAAAVRRLRIFRGYAGWAPAQLESELDVGAWMVLDADADDLFTPNPERLWRDVLRRQGGRLAWVADAPDDLSNN